MSDHTKAIGAITAVAATAAELGAIPIVTYTTAAPGILEFIGLTTTATIAVPAAGVVAVGGLLYYGAKILKKVM